MLKNEPNRPLEGLLWEWWHRSFLKKVIITNKLPFHKIIKPSWINTKIYQLAHRKPFLFEHILIQTNNQCTRKCSFCLYGMKDVTIEDYVMEDWLFEKIVKELAEINYSGRVSLFELNEPLTDPRIFDMVQYIKTNVPESYQMLVTNGDLLTKQKCIDLVSSGTDYLCVNSYTSSAFRKAKTIVEKLPADIKAHVSHQSLFTSEFAGDNRGGNLSHIQQHKEVLREPCSRVSHVLYIKPDGTAVSCFSDFFNTNVMGDAKKQTIKEIWFGEKFTQLRNNLNKGKREVSELCSKCNMGSGYTFVSHRAMEERQKRKKPVMGGIVGASSSAQMFYPALKKYSNVKYIVSKSGFDNKLFHNQKLHVTNTFQDVLEDPEIDYIFVANQNKFHYEMAKQALLAGKNVLVEKPITLDINHLDELIAISKEMDLLYGGIFQFRFLDVVKVVKELIVNKKFGKLLFINARLLWNRLDSYFVRGRGSWDIDGGGVLIKQAIHCLDLLMYIAGEPVDNHSYHLNQLSHGETEDTALISIKFKDCFGSLIATTSYRKGSAATIEIIGTDGWIVFDLSGNIKYWEHVCLHRPKIDKKIDIYEKQIENFISSINHPKKLAVTAKACRESLFVILDGYKKDKVHGGHYS